MATYANDLRLKEITTGDEDGTWGTSTNTNLSLIADAFSYGTKQMAADADETFTMPDFSADGTRSLYLKITSAVSLTTTRVVTLGPNTVSKVWIIENATSGSQTITIKQGSGATVNVANGSKVMVYTDGAGAGAAVVNANPSLIAEGTQTYYVTPTANAFGTYTSLSAQGTTASATTREFLVNIGLTSNTGSAASSYNRDKVALYSGIQAQSGTGDVWAFNPVTVLDSGSGTYNSYIIEADLNNNVADRGNTAGPSGLAAPVSYGIGVTGAGTYKSTSGILVSGVHPTNSTPIWNRGITFALDSVEQSTFADYTSSDVSLDLQGTHKQMMSITGTVAADGSNNGYSVISQPTLATDVTNIGAAFYSSPQTGASGTMAAFQHFSVNNVTVNGSAALTTQYGFLCGDLTAGSSFNFGYYSGVNAGSGSFAFYGAGTAASYFGGNVIFKSAYTEEVYALSGTALDPSNGTIQTKTLSGNTTFTDSLGAGQSMVLMLGAGASYTVTWPTMTWASAAGNTAPTLTASDIIVFWKVGTTLYGAYAGSYA